MDKKEKIKRFLLLYIMVMAALVYIVAFARLVNAATVEFSWMQNTETNLVRYEVYCDENHAEEVGENGHKYWKQAPRDNIIDGRVHYKWEFFPTNDRYWCVAVAVGMYNNKEVTSPFSEELEVDMRPCGGTFAAPSYLKATSVDGGCEDKE